ncbi:MarR family winged helix-turn-helix transcriptional regulator [Gimesia maris]|nr:MarR family transcriptional regulator [Gimesia maris]
MNFDSKEQESFLHLWRTYDCLKVLEDSLFLQFELSPQQYNVLRLLQMYSPRTMQTMELGRRLISRCPDTSRMLDRLEKRLLVKRSRLPENRRVVEIAITKQGLALLKKMEKAVLEMHRQQLGHLSEKEHNSLIQLLKKARKPHEDSSCDWLES